MSFTDAIYEAVRIRHPHDARSAVHDLVGTELRKLDSGVHIEATDYFNHSFVPDFVLSWGGQDEVRSRDLFLRLNVSSPAFGEDLDLLSDRGAFFLGVFDQHPLQDVPWASMPMSASLVTHAHAVEQFDDELQRDSRAVGATREIVRRGVGAIDTPSAAGIGSSYRVALSVIDELRERESDEEAVGAVQHLLEHLRPVLQEEGALEIEQELHAFWILGGGAPSHFPGQQGWNPQELSRSALRAILLDLIDSGGVGIDPTAWLELAGHVSAEEIGTLLRRPVFDGGFDHLAAALSPTWTAKWVWVTEQQSESLLPRPHAWLVDDEILGIDVGRVQMFFADDGRHFMNKPTNAILPALEEASDFLRSSDVLGAELRSASSDLGVFLREGAGGQSVEDVVSTLLADPQQVAQKVRSMTVGVPDAGHTARVLFDERKIDFGESTNIRVAASLAFRYFSGGDEQELSAFNEFLGI